MQIEVSQGRGTNLPVIGQFPSLRLARLEGNNGIGKTLTVKILQLCTGSRAFLNEVGPWATFRSRIGKASVTVTDLRGCESIVWTFLPSNLTEDDEPDDSWFEVRIDGDRSSLAEAVDLLTVERLAGDVGLSETLSEQVEADRVAMISRYGGVLDEKHGSLVSVERLLNTASDLIAQLDAGATERLLEEVTALEGDAEKARETSESATELQSILGSATETKQRLDHLRSVQGGIGEKIARKTTDIEQLKTSKETILNSLEKTEKEAATSEENRKKLERVRKRLERRNSESANAESELDALFKRTGVKPKADTSKEREVAISELKELNERQSRINDAPYLKKVSRDLLQILEPFEAEGFGELVLIQDKGITLSQLVHGVKKRSESINETEDQDEDLKPMVATLENRVRDLEQIEIQYKERETARRLRETATKDLEELEQEVNPDVIERLNLLRSRLEKANSDLRFVSAERQALQQVEQAGATGQTVETLEGQLASTLPEGVTETTLEEEHQRAIRDAKQADGEHKAIIERLTRKREEVRAAEQRAKGILEEFETTKELNWCADYVREQTEVGPKVEFAIVVEALGKLWDDLQIALTRASRIRTQINGLNSASTSVLQILKGESLATKLPDLHEPLREIYSREFESIFRVDSIRNALFGADSEILGFEIEEKKLQVRYRVANREEFRSIESLSSGENAFAYTEARLNALDQFGRTSKNKLIVLDEFGAFMARNRIAQLNRRLKDRLDQAEGEQILYILPATTDFEARVRASRNDEEKELNRNLSTDFAERGYVFEEVSI